MDEFQLRNRIQEIRSYIASNWPGVEERKHLYQRLANLERMLREMQEKTEPPKNA